MSASPPYTKPEIERRWLFTANPEPKVTAERERKVEDRYILGTRLRLRKVTEVGKEPVYKLGKKYESGRAGTHHVVTTYLSEAEYNVLAALPARSSRKRRLSFAGGALDVYETPNAGLRVFEMELTSAEEAALYTPPPGVGREVTDDAAFTGYALAGAD